MKEDIVSRVLLAETAYHEALEKAADRARAYEETVRAEQHTRIAQMERQWQAHERESNEHHQALLHAKTRELDAALLARKRELRACQQRAAETIAERLKEEVLSQYGGR